MFLKKGRGKVTGAHRKKRFHKEDLPLYVMASPTVVWLIVFCYAPILGLVMAFQDLNITLGILGSPYGSTLLLGNWAFQQTRPEQNRVLSYPLL